MSDDKVVHFPGRSKPRLHTGEKPVGLHIVPPRDTSKPSAFAAALAAHKAAETNGGTHGHTK